MDELLTKIAHENSVEGAIGLAREEAFSCGAAATTFHIAAPHASQVGPEVFIAIHGHDPDWARDYDDPAIRRHDPFPDHVMRGGIAIRFAGALAKMSLSEAQRNFVGRYHAPRLEQTFAMPVYGPFDFDTYSSFTHSRALGPEDENLIEHIVAVVEAMNRRIAHLLETRTGLHISLSEREAEVLHWIGRSKSNGDIATILDVSATTIDTYVRRLFAKLQVNDRIAAAVKGIRLGLIRF
jgi:DNA-binding CsgD family transcriptional regulator